MNRPRKNQLNLNLPPCYYWRHGAFHYVKKGVSVKVGTTKQAVADHYRNQISQPSGGMSALIDEAISALKDGWSKNTLKQYEGAARKLKKAFSEFAPPDVKQKDVVAFKIGYKRIPNMTNRCLSLLREIFDYALEQQLPGIDSNPASGVKRLKEAKRTRLIQIGEYVAIYAQAGPRLQIIMDLLIRTGERINDVLKIRRADLLPEGIRFIQQKTGAKRVVPWTPELRAIVDRAKALHGNVHALTLLYNRRRKAPDYRTIKLQWDEACKAALVEDATLHDMRAVAATWAKKQGLNPTLLLGHTNATQTERYLRDREEVVAEGPSFNHLPGMNNGKK